MVTLVPYAHLSLDGFDGGRRPLHRKNAGIAAFLLAVFQIASGAPQALAANVEAIGQVEIAPLFYQPFACVDHPEGQLSDLGDALGTDCFVMGGFGKPSGFMKLYRNDGIRNDDWYGWHAEIHAPFDGIVKDIRINPITNVPGTMGKPPASYITFERGDGTIVVFAHVDDIRVKLGEHVVAGQVVALDGNNGTARGPHVHVGAYRGSIPLQIRWDLRIEGQIPSLRGK